MLLTNVEFTDDQVFELLERANQELKPYYSLHDVAQLAENTEEHMKSADEQQTSAGTTIRET